jgi:hypothetical protein
MNQEPHKSNVVLIIIAIIGVIGTIIGATITVIGNYNVEKLRQETELTRIALASIATQREATQPSATSTISLPTPTDIATPTFVNTATVTSPNTNAIAGNWVGTVVDDGTNYRLQVKIFIEESCEVGEICGTTYLPDIPCTGNLELKEIENNVFVFIEKEVTGEQICVSGGQDTLELLLDGTISRRFVSSDKSVTSYGVLKRP